MRTFEEPKNVTVTLPRSDYENMLKRIRELEGIAERTEQTLKPKIEKMLFRLADQIVSVRDGSMVADYLKRRSSEFINAVFS